MDKNQNTSGQDKNNQEQYNLYTEKIVKKPGSKIKRGVKHIAKIVGSAVVFGVTAALVMALVYPNVKKFTDTEEPTTRQGTVIPTDSQTEERRETESTDNESDGEQNTGEESTSEYEDGQESASQGDGEQESTSETCQETEGWIDAQQFESMFDIRMEHAFDTYRPGINEYVSIHEALKTVADGIRGSLVSVLVSEDGENWDYVSGDGVFGFIAAEDEEYFYILTVKELTEKGNLSVVFGDGTVTGGMYLTGDATTNLAVVAAAKSEFAKLPSERVYSAVLGNSYVVEQGDPLLIIGDVYEQHNMAVYATALSTQNVVMDTDSSYRYISTDIAASESDCGIIINISGEVIGLIPYGKEALSGKIVNGYGISELKRLIERLINGKVTPYVGIHPQTVTAAMKEAYGMPEGIYVDSVEADSPAYYAGIQSGDVITAVGGESVATIRTFQNVIYTMEPETEAVLSISRPGRDGYRDIEITVELGVE